MNLQIEPFSNPYRSLKGTLYNYSLNLQVFLCPNARNFGSMACALKAYIAKTVK